MDCANEDPHRVVVTDLTLLEDGTVAVVGTFTGEVEIAGAWRLSAADPRDLFVLRLNP